MAKPLTPAELDKIHLMVGLSPYVRAKLELWADGVFTNREAIITLKSIEVRLRTRNLWS